MATTFFVNRELIAHLLGLPSSRVWVEYDAEADVLYISFRKPQQADDSIMEEDGNIYHYSGDQLVGVTVLHARGRLAA